MGLGRIGKHNRSGEARPRASVDDHTNEDVVGDDPLSVSELGVR